MNLFRHIEADYRRIARDGIPDEWCIDLATLDDVVEAIRDFYLDTGTPIAMKPAGGIRTAKQALQFLIAVKETLGDEWLNNTRYRFGASSLLNDLLRQIAKERTGAYQAPYYFSEAAESY